MIKIKRELLEFKRPTPHSKFSPSSSDRWMACPFSIKFTEGIPESTSKYAEEGTMAHELCEHVFRMRLYGVPIPLDMQLRLSQLSDQGAEMEDCAEQYVDLLEAWMRLPELGDIVWYGIEKGIPIFPNEGCFGTGDFTIVGTKGCAVIDFKYGRGKEVKAGSTQLKAYALGLFRHLENIPNNYEFNAVVFQPRINMIPKVDTYSPLDMAEFEADVTLAIDKSKEEGLSPFEGNHCFWCPAKRTRDPAMKCPAIKQKTIDVANQNFNEFFTDMNLQKNVDSELDRKRDQALIKIMSLAPLIKKMAEDAKDELAFRLQQGEAIQGVVLRDKEGRRKWRTDNVEKMNQEIMAMFPGRITDATETVKKLKAIGKIEKIVGKKSCDNLTVRPITKEVILQDETIQKVLTSFSAFTEKTNI